MSSAVFSSTAPKFTAEEPPQRQKDDSSDEYIGLLELWSDEYGNVEAVKKLPASIRLSYHKADKALVKRVEAFLKEARSSAPVKKKDEPDEKYGKRVRAWVKTFLTALRGDHVQISADIQKETVVKTFEDFPKLLSELPNGVQLSVKETAFAFAELITALDDFSPPPSDWITGFKFWSLLPVEVHNLART
uniref:Uncharacterized protein n=1 Tax=Chromera velia CCMP2878 TaxID=1169474 RepID=A0A0G4HB58_9ALVE|mmetsp:Transcript_31519/g.62316  ORF Transcript_31519/g.62316 Transcript_31519/m.62316 type:complete len:190 (-) Transcript_31519:1672-2241(-)|eukprot:Cvel_6123.t1-p1 / transcript=Cvel_6123.t1 / gene=Cvel_6123 / organism=Chromera_velia_CCMP2878 / gene_product=hypothetical protein / transcript_product=hypothetical protein / location=Cvel_scaffold295:85093-85659(+) / protein_length=189 / sequence_SO=supercontig / SO=protein_coding / is_pseudo=false